MAIKYVENYRQPDDVEMARGDSETIQAAINSLADGDTLIFDGSRTYALDEPVSFTSYNTETEDGITRKFLVIDGNGCTICGSNTYISKYGNKSNNKNALFYISDEMKNGIINSVIKNFIFKWSAHDLYSTNEYPFSNRNIALAVVTPDYEKAPDVKSIYYTNGAIENCKFYNFGIGVYQCGDDSIIKGCYFESCYKGIYSDGSVHNVFEDNLFFTTIDSGIHVNVSFDSVVRNNKFYRCYKYSIFANGQYESSTHRKEIDVSIINNKILGWYTDTRNDYGIKLQALNSFVVSDNFISGISRKSNIDGHGYGIGIWVSGNLDETKGICKSRRGIISNNVVKDCYGEAIKLDIVTDCVIRGNLLCSNSKHGEETNKIGILIRKDTNNICVTDNTICYYGDRAIKNYCSHSSEVLSNTIFNETHNLLRTIENASYVTPQLIIPEDITDIENGEYFYFRVPDNYAESAITAILYKGGSCLLYEPAPSDHPEWEGMTYTTLPTSAAGEYILLKLFVDGTSNKFIFCRMANL